MPGDLDGGVAVHPSPSHPPSQPQPQFSRKPLFISLGVVSSPLQTLPSFRETTTIVVLHWANVVNLVFCRWPVFSYSSTIMITYIFKISSFRNWLSNCFSYCKWRFLCGTSRAIFANCCRTTTVAVVVASIGCRRGTDYRAPCTSRSQLGGRKNQKQMFLASSSQPKMPLWTSSPGIEKRQNSHQRRQTEEEGRGCQFEERRLVWRLTLLSLLSRLIQSDFALFSSGTDSRRKLPA